MVEISSKRWIDTNDFAELTLDYFVWNYIGTPTFSTPFDSSFAIILITSDMFLSRKLQTEPSKKL